MITAPPSISIRLDLLNELALYDETDRELTFPNGKTATPIARDLMARLDEILQNPAPENWRLAIWSFDIDLTLAMPEDEPGCRGFIPISRLHHLRGCGAIVGTCSDREPSNQRNTMQDLGFSPDFCIPKEMLSTLRRLFPDAKLIHVGDDAQRDRQIAQECGVEHRWPTAA